MNNDNQNMDQSALYHYTNANALVGIIKNREVWATGSNYLNDPTEVSYAATALAEEMQQALRYCEHKEQVQNALDLLKASFVDPNPTAQYHEDRTFVSSFSRSDRSLTLWRLYSGRNGFCVGFDQSQLLSWVGREYPDAASESLGMDEQEERAALITNYQISARIEDVTYGDHRISPLLQEVLSAASSDPWTFESESRFRKIFASLSTIKHPAYEDEREARLILQEVHHHADDPGVRVSASGALVAYRKIVFPFDAVTSITIAPGSNGPQQSLALQALMAQGGRAPYERVEIREAELPFNWQP